LAKGEVGGLTSRGELTRFDCILVLYACVFLSSVAARVGQDLCLSSGLIPSRIVETVMLGPLKVYHLDGLLHQVAFVQSCPAQ
jgi:hypothetical protein